MTVTLLQDSFQNNPDGPPGNADSGQPWVLTGPSQLVCFVGFLMLGGTDLNGYAQVTMDDAPIQVNTSFVFTNNTPGQQSTAGFILHNEPVFTGFDMGCHIVITPFAIAYQVRESGGAFVDLIYHAFAAPLPTFSQLFLQLNFDGNTVTILAPDGTQLQATDPRIGALIGPKLVLQSIRSDGSYGNTWWVDVTALGADPISSWRLVNPEIVEKHQLAGGLVVTHRRTLTVFTTDGVNLHLADDGAPLSGASEQGNIPYEDLTYIWYGGHRNTTDDPEIRDLWLAHDLDVEEIA